MLKALFFDLDGTLLDHDKRISSKTKSTLEKCKNKGLQLFIATARPPLLDRMLSWDESILSLFDGGLYYNGGCVKIGEYKHYKSVSDEIVHKAIKSVVNYNELNIALQLEDEKHAFRFPLDERGYKGWGVAADESLTLEQAHNLRTVKILIFYSNLIESTTPVPKDLVISLKTACNGKAQFYLTDKGKCVQIMGASVNKLEGIEKIRNQIGIGKDEIAVFGDDINDLEMLSAYPFSIAMGNAESHVKDAAKYITLDNNNDGIHHAICSILNLL